MNVPPDQVRRSVLVGIPSPATENEGGRRTGSEPLGMQHRIARGLAGLLTLLLLAEVATVLAHGATIGNRGLRLELTEGWTTETELVMSCLPGYASSCTRILNFGFFRLCLTNHQYYGNGQRHGVDQMQE